MKKASKKTLNTINWFKERGFLLGRDKVRKVYYVVDGATNLRYDFGSIEQCQQFAENLNAYRLQTENEYERD